MYALNVLKDDHDKVRDLFVQFRAAHKDKDEQKMVEVTGKIFDELEIHTGIEERVFYPAVKKAGGEDLEELTHESVQEHHVVDVLMTEIKEMEPSNPDYSAKMTVLIENVEHHAGEEEKEMFPKVSNLFSNDELQELGQDLMREKHVVRLEKKNVDELRTEAGNLEIDGRSDMDRDALVEAIVAQYT